MPRQRRSIPWLDWRDDIAYVYWYDAESQTTKRLSLRTSDAGEAQARYAAFLVGGKEIVEPSRVDGLTVSQILDDYFTEHVIVKVIDRENAEIKIGHLKAYFGDTLVKDVDIPSCRSYAAGRREGRVSGSKSDRYRNRTVQDSTIRKELSLLGTAAKHAMKWRRITADQLPSLEFPAAAEQNPLTDDEWLTREEYRRAVAAADGDLKHMIVLSYETASRKTAIETLTRFQIDLMRSRLTLRNPSENELQRRSKKRRPIVPITTVMRPVLEELLLSPQADGRLFRQPTNFYWRFRKHMETIGLPQKRYPHILRHTRASHLLMDGVSLWDVAKLLGDTVATVERVYGHFSPEHMAKAIEGGRQ